MLLNRRKTTTVKIGSVWIGSDYPISVQSMTCTDTRDIKATVKQIKKLTAVGCEIVRIAVLNSEAAKKISEIKKQISVPLIADIHFDHRLALTALQQGIDGLRLNPGNIKDKSKVKLIVKEANAREIPIRIGVNLGSVPYEIIKKYNNDYVKAMVHTAFEHIKILEDMNFSLIKISLKANDIQTTVQAYKLLAEQCSYPFHIGITEAGTEFSGTVKSAIGLGILLFDGIGDTIRVSLTADPVKEVKVGWEILKSLGLREKGPKLISCPTCGRCEINLIPLARAVEKGLKKYSQPITVAVMGCVVNGPGEARMADIGIAGTKDGGILFKKGKILGSVKQENLLSALFTEIERL